jgi:hypothetical protein
VSDSSRMNAYYRKPSRLEYDPGRPAGLTARARPKARPGAHGKPPQPSAYHKDG